MPDLRLDADFPRHPKTRKLKRRLGTDAVLALIALWCFARKYHPDGRLDHMTIEDVELAAEWEGEAGTFVAALVEVGFVEQAEGSNTYVLHDWADWQPFAVGSEERSKHSRKAADARWNRYASKPGNAHECSEHCPEHPPALQGASLSNALFDPDPSFSEHSDPNPSFSEDSDPNPKEKEAASAAAPAQPASETLFAPDFRSSEGHTKVSKKEQPQALFELWNKTVKRLPKAHALSEERERNARARLRHHSLEELGLIFRRLDESDFAASKKWATFDWAIESETNLLKVLEGKFDNPSKSGNGAKALETPLEVNRRLREE
jgi:hypothetical protein